MLLRRLADKLRTGNWLAFGVELTLVVAGILLAFQLDRAYQASQDRDLEQRYLVRLGEDLRLDSGEIAANVARTGARLEQLALLESVIGDPSVAASDPHAFALALEQVTWRSVPAITSGTIDELQSTGRSVLLRSEQLGEIWPTTTAPSRSNEGSDSVRTIRTDSGWKRWDFSPATI